MYLGKFVHTETGKIMMSILLGFGLASLFRVVCKNKDCLIFHAPPLANFKDKVYKNNNGNARRCSRDDYGSHSRCNLKTKV